MTHECFGGDSPCWSHLFEDEDVPTHDDDVTPGETSAIASLVVHQTKASMDGVGGEERIQPSRLEDRQAGDQEGEPYTHA
jgi:hypothetical protein